MLGRKIQFGARATRPAKQDLVSFAAALCLAMLGWLGQTDPPFIDAVPGLSIFLGAVAMPGVLVGAAFAMVFSPQGAHSDIEALAGIIVPLNVCLYFLVVRMILKNLVRRQEGDALDQSHRKMNE